MRNVHFRISEEMYILIQQGQEARRGHAWTDSEIWDQIMRQVQRMEEHDIKLRAESARRRRIGADRAVGPT